MSMTADSTRHCAKCDRDRHRAQFPWDDLGGDQARTCMFCDPTNPNAHVKEPPKPVPSPRNLPIDPVPQVACLLCEAKLSARRVKDYICVCTRCKNRIGRRDFDNLHHFWLRRRDDKYADMLRQLVGRITRHRP